MRQKKTIFLFVTLVLASCSGHYARLSREEIVKEFPLHAELQEYQLHTVDIPGVVDVIHLGDRVYCMTMKPDGLISVLDEDKLEPCCAPFLFLGNGPLEVLSPIPFRQMYLHTDNGDQLADFFNMGNRLIRLNLTRSETSGGLVGESLGPIPSELADRGPIAILGNQFYFFQNPVDQKCVRRGIWKDGEITYAPAQETLNSFSLQEADGFMFNIFFSAFSYNPALRRFVEASTMQNTIHVYDLDGSFSKTISINGPVQDYQLIEKQGMEGLVQTAETVRPFPDYFVVLYRERPLSSQTDPSPRLLFFDWDGNPLMDISMTCQATAFDIDLQRNRLYLSNQDSGTVSVVDISEYLSKVKDH